MWSNSDFAVPISSFVSPVPVPGVDPLAGDCFIIRINGAWLPYIRGALQQLLLQTTWDTDEAGLAIVQAQATNLLFAFNSLEPGDCGAPGGNSPGISGDDDMSCCLRFQDGKLQTFCCGEWTDVPGQAGAAGPGGPGQPGAGNLPPAPAGGTGNYCFALGGSDTRILPTTVSAGDILLFNNLDGAWNDKREVIWNCPDGWVYALGSCGQTFPHGSPDPLPTALHMSLIIEINGNYYDAVNPDINGDPQPFTVPGGISNAQVIIRPNIDDNTQVQGNVTFCVTVTNEQPVTGSWIHTFDFLASPGGFTPWPNSTFTPVGNGSWVTGVGWGATSSTDGSADLAASVIERTLPAGVVINTAEITYNLAKGTVLAGVFQSVAIDLSGSGGTTSSISAATDADGTDKTLAIIPGAYTVNHFKLDILNTFKAVGGGVFGTSRITKLVLTGEGTDPF